MQRAYSLQESKYGLACLQYYLSQQVHAVLSRLVEARIAQCLGLDASTEGFERERLIAIYRLIHLDAHW